MFGPALLQRAWETAELVGLTPQRDDFLLEWDSGECEGITTAETRATVEGWSLLGWERENRVIRRWNDPCGW